MHDAVMILPIILPPEGVTLDGAKASIERHGHHIYSVEAIKLEALA